MTWEQKHRENELKLDILESLARSQRALASMEESLAAVIGESPETAARLRQQLELLVRCQSALAAKLGGLRLREVKQGRPGPVWLAPGYALRTAKRPSPE